MDKDEFFEDLIKEIEMAPVGKLRCESCDEMVPVNGAYMDLLIRRGVSTIGKCSKCRAKDKK